MKTFTLFTVVVKISNTKYTHCSWPSPLHLLNTRWLSYVTLYSRKDIFFSLKVRAFSNKKTCVKSNDMLKEGKKDGVVIIEHIVPYTEMIPD